MKDSSTPTRSSVIFIPLSSLPDGFRPENGDVIIEGKCTFSADEQGYGAAAASPERLTALSVAKRTFGSLRMRQRAESFS